MEFIKEVLESGPSRLLGLKLYYLDVSNEEIHKKVFSKKWCPLEFYTEQTGNRKSDFYQKCNDIFSWKNHKLIVSKSKPLFTEDTLQNICVEKIVKMGDREKIGVKIVTLEMEYSIDREEFDDYEHYKIYAKYVFYFVGEFKRVKDQILKIAAKNFERKENLMGQKVPKKFIDFFINHKRMEGRYCPDTEAYGYISYNLQVL